MMHPRHNQAGFTLIEALVYVAILSVVSVSAVTILFDLEDLFFEYQVQQALFQSGNTSIERVLTELRQAESVDTFNSEFASSTAGQLTLLRDTTTTEFARTGEELIVSVNGNPEGALTTDEVTVNGFTVYRYVLTNGELIRVRLTLTGAVGGATSTRTFYGGAVIRGSYD